MSDSKNRVALVTGGTGAIGRAIAKRIVEHGGYQVVVIARDSGKGANVVEQLQNETGSSQIRYELADLSRRSQIFALAERWEGGLDVLVNNAAETPRRREQTVDGIERQFATNVLGYYHMMTAFQAALVACAPSRIVNVASYWAGGLDVDDLEFNRRQYDNDSAYRQSKQADRMLTVAFSERLKRYGISVNACHPGDVNSKLSNDLGFGGHESPNQGARTPAWLATEPVGGQVTGKYFEHQRETPCRFSADSEAVKRLFEACQAYS